MRHWIRFAVLLACLLGAAAAQASPKIERIKTPGGIEVWFVREPSIPMLALNAAWRGGAASEPADKQGLASLTTALLTEGAGDLGPDDFQNALRKQAIALDFDADRDYVTLSLRTLSEHRERAFELLRMAMTAPRFEDEPINRIKAGARVSYERSRSNPNALAGERFSKAAFGDHPYGRRTSATAESLERIGREDFVAFSRQVLARDDLLIAAVGDIAPEELARLVDESFGKLPEKAQVTLPPRVAPKTPASPAVVSFPVPQSVVLIGAPGIAREDPDWYAASVLNQVLGGAGMSSRLFEELREKRGLVYSVGTQLIPYKSAALFSGSFATSNKDVAAALQLVRDEFKRVAKDGVTEAELQAAKDYLTGSFPLRLTSDAGIAGTLLAMRISGLPIDYIDRYPALVRSVSADDIKRVAHRLFDREDFLVVVAGQPVGLGG
ncbi:MAG TPA: pitrilysin family protein [Ferrovibrio sp.]|uniref:M16 family metallopeptidase n=1 Tax=Ferrovibrio sp. TaxID=1917215 RepID=UPI002ED23B87